MICSLWEDPLDQIAFMDYHLVYEVKSLIGIQLYSYGLVEYANNLCSNSALEYVPGVVHVQLAAYRTWKTENPWEKFLKIPQDLGIANLCYTHALSENKIKFMITVAERVFSNKQVLDPRVAALELANLDILNFQDFAYKYLTSKNFATTILLPK